MIKYCQNFDNVQAKNTIYRENAQKDIGDVQIY